MLIKVADLEAYGQSTFTTDAHVWTAEAAIIQASAAVEDHCKRQFALVSDDEITLRWRPSIVLPNPPVIAVSVFQVDGVDADYSIDDSGRYWPRATGDQIAVTYTHGYATVPETVRLVVARVSNRIVRNPQMRSTYTGPDGLNYASASDVGPRILTGDEVTALRRYSLHKAR